jgi:SAM-dependent methyltransferase
MYLTYDVAAYFDKIVKLRNKKVLDFGCNHANFLKYGFQGDYTGIDIIEDIIQDNAKKYPQYNWIHYNQHNNQYNISHCNSSWPIKDKFDLVCAFSVFTHTSYIEFENTIKKLKNNLTSSGKILATYIDINDEQNIKIMFQFRNDILKNISLENFLKEIKKYNTVTISVVLSNMKTEIFYNQLSLPQYNEPCYFITLYNGNWIQQQLDAQIIDVTHYFDDIRGAQKCLIIK